MPGGPRSRTAAPHDPRAGPRASRHARADRDRPSTARQTRQPTHTITADGRKRETTNQGETTAQTGNARERGKIAQPCSQCSGKEEQRCVMSHLSLCVRSHSVQQANADQPIDPLGLECDRLSDLQSHLSPCLHVIIGSGHIPDDQPITPRDARGLPRELAVNGRVCHTTASKHLEDVIIFAASVVKKCRLAKASAAEEGQDTVIDRDGHKDDDADPLCRPIEGVHGDLS